MWNEAEGTAEEAVVTLDFDALDGGFLLPGEADPVWARAIDRMFVSLVAPDYDLSEGGLATPAEGSAEKSGIACTGAGVGLAVGEQVVPEPGGAGQRDLGKECVSPFRSRGGPYQ